MQKPITVDRRGTMTLPKPMRSRLSLLENGGILIAEETAEGILLRPGKVIPTKLYTEEEVAEYKRSDDELRPLLPKLRKPANPQSDQ